MRTRAPAAGGRAWRRVIVMRPLGEGALCCRHRAAAGRAPRARRRDLAPGAAEVGALRRAGRRRHPRHAKPGARAGKRRSRRAAVVRRGAATSCGTLHRVKPDDTRTVYDGKLFDVVVERWGDHEREIVEHPGAVAIVARRRRGDGCARAAAARGRTQGAARASGRHARGRRTAARERAARAEGGDRSHGRHLARARGLLHDAWLLPRANASLRRRRNAARRKRARRRTSNSSWCAGLPPRSRDVSARSRTRSPLAGLLLYLRERAGKRRSPCAHPPPKGGGDRPAFPHRRRYLAARDTSVTRQRRMRADLSTR